MINQKILDVRSGKFVEMTVHDAYEVINRTQGLGDDFDKFLDGASDTVKNIEFKPISTSLYYGFRYLIRIPHQLSSIAPVTITTFMSSPIFYSRPPSTHC